MKILSVVFVLFALNCQADPVTASPTAGPAATMSTTPSIDQKATPAPSPTASSKKKAAQKKKHQPEQK